MILKFITQYILYVTSFSFLDEFENNDVQSMNVTDDMDFGEFVGGGHLLSDDLNKNGIYRMLTLFLHDYFKKYIIF